MDFDKTILNAGYSRETALFEGNIKRVLELFIAHDPIQEVEMIRLEQSKRSKNVLGIAKIVSYVFPTFAPHRVHPA